DVMMPQVDGLEVLRRIRSEKGALPIIMLTARGDETDRVVGLELGADGVGRVLRQPCEGVGKHLAKLRRKLEDPSLLGTRLFFPVRTGDAPEQRIRVSIYFRHVLVHSRVMSVRTSAGRKSSEAAISFRTDYLLTRRLDPAKLAAIAEHDLSLMLNGDDDGGHQLRIFGREAVCEDVHFPPLALEEIIAEIRGAMRLAAWGSKEEWDGQERFAFRYTDMGAANRRALHLAQLREDLFRMARVGRRSFDQIRRPVNMVLRRTAPGAKLEALLDHPAFVQFASRASATELIPLAGLYQLPLDPNLSQYRLCPTFERTLETGASLEGSECWQGRCASAAMDVVCPSGFWGFRHYLGVPVTLGEGRESELPPSLGCVGAPRVTAAVSTDENFERRESHLAELRALLPDPDCLLVAKTRDQAIAALQSNPGHVVYFYCHGGLGGINGNVPALLVGPNDSPWIDASLISQVLEGRWQPQGPLVVLNGCRTTAVLPSQAFDLVTAFVQDAGAAGVIGTEITLYEELAASFATAFIRALLIDKVELGVAVRRARLALLADCNPLGLVYTSFALSRLRLSP
ncbi:MAG: response regulator, partial [Deltaproteobacteria bacterium]|nr:response regulator [Deltaproteobacteria bacterium]